MAEQLSENIAVFLEKVSENFGFLMETQNLSQKVSTF